MFKKLKALFIAEDSDLKEALEKKEAIDQGSVQTPVEETPVSSAPQSSSTSESFQAPANIEGEVDDKFINILFAAMEKANLPSFDYIEFKQSLRNLAKMPMDEATRFKSAFATAQTMGATPQKLVDAAQHYINILNAEEQKFQSALANQRNKQIGNKEASIKNMTMQLQNKEQKITQLQKEIEADKAKMNSMKEEISGAAVKMEKTQKDFVASYNALVGQIKADAEKIKQYLM
ncbi:MAG: hypothetical protein AB8F74_15595 [Saprospiraceae bacterium]